MKSIIIGFDRMSAAYEKAAKAALKLINTYDWKQDESAFVSLKQTAWERRNPNAPFWRKLERRRRA